MEGPALDTLTPTSANALQVSMDTTATKVKSPRTSETFLLMFSVVGEDVSVVFVPQQRVRPPTAVATEMEDANISAESFRIVLTCVFVLRDTDSIKTTAPACPKV